MPDRPTELAAVDIIWGVEGKEIAVNTLWLRHHHETANQFDWDVALQTVASHIVDSFSDSGKGGAIFPYMSNQILLTRVDAYAVPPVGKATNKRSATPSGTVGGSASGDYSPIMGAVIQLWGYNPLGFVQDAMRHRGRLFAIGTPMSYFSDIGRLSSTQAADIATAWGHFLNDVQGVHADPAGNLPTPDYFNVGVFSRTNGAFYQLEAVTVATKPGIQHSRMNALDTGRSSSVTIDHS